MPILRLFNIGHHPCNSQDDNVNINSKSESVFALPIIYPAIWEDTPADDEPYWVSSGPPSSSTGQQTDSNFYGSYKNDRRESIGTISSSGNAGSTFVHERIVDPGSSNSNANSTSTLSTSNPKGKHRDLEHQHQHFLHQQHLQQEPSSPEIQEIEWHSLSTHPTEPSRFGSEPLHQGFLRLTEGCTSTEQWVRKWSKNESGQTYIQRAKDGKDLNIGGCRALGWVRLGSLLEPFWHIEDLVRIRIDSKKFGGCLTVMEYLERTKGVDLASMLAVMATMTWEEGSLLTRNTDYCVRRSKVIPRPRVYLHADNQSFLDQNTAEDSNSDTDRHTSDGSIRNPYRLLPRRLWDLVNNRVVDLDMFAKRGVDGEIITPRVPSTGFWAITHSWTSDMVSWMTPVNNYRWPVPLPEGVTLEMIRNEALDAGATYCWLDVLCLRQKMTSSFPGGDIELSEKKRLEEWSIDIPTVGNVFRQATNVLRYFNGIGRTMKLEGWGDQKHWINRAWTLQETRPEHMMVNGGIPRETQFPLRSKVEINGSIREMRQILMPLSRIVHPAEPEYANTDSALLDQNLPLEKGSRKTYGDIGAYAWEIRSVAFVCIALVLAASRSNRRWTLKLTERREPLDPRLVRFLHIASRAGSWVGPGFLATCFSYLLQQYPITLARLLSKTGPTRWLGGKLLKGGLISTLLPLFLIEGLIRDIPKKSMSLFERLKRPIHLFAAKHLRQFELHTGMKVKPRLLWAPASISAVTLLLAQYYTYQERTKKLAIAEAALQLAQTSSPRHLDFQETPPSSYCSILEVIGEMARRNASNELDKISGLGYLMKCSSLPIYSESQPLEDAWIRLVSHLPYPSQLELLFNFPDARENCNGGGNSGQWLPTWGQLTRLRVDGRSYLQRPVWPPPAFIRNPAFDEFYETQTFSSEIRTYDPDSGSLFVPSCARVLLCTITKAGAQSTAGTYEVHVVGRNNGFTHTFYCPQSGTLRGVPSSSSRRQQILLSKSRNNRPGQRNQTVPESLTDYSSLDEKFVLISHARDDESGPLTWVVARLLYPHSGTYSVSFGQYGIGETYHTMSNEDEIGPLRRKLTVDAFGMTEDQAQRTLLVRKVGVLVTDDMAPLTAPERFSPNHCLSNTPIVFV